MSERRTSPPLDHPITTAAVGFGSGRTQASSFPSLSLITHIPQTRSDPPQEDQELQPSTSDPLQVLNSAPHFAATERQSPPSESQLTPLSPIIRSESAFVYYESSNQENHSEPLTSGASIYFTSGVTEQTTDSYQPDIAFRGSDNIADESSDHSPASESPHTNDHGYEDCDNPSSKLQAIDPEYEYFQDSENEEDCANPEYEFFDPEDSDCDMALNIDDKKALFEQQNHYYNDEAARNRGRQVIETATNIIAAPRGSPTAKQTTPSIHQAIHNRPKLNESVLQDGLLNALFKASRMVRKASVPPSKPFDLYDYEPEPRAWTKDYLGRKTRANFHQKSVPQMKPPAGTFDAFFAEDPKLKTPIPDLTWGLCETLLNVARDRWPKLSKTYNASVTKGLFHAFCSMDIKTLNRPTGELQLQCAMAGSAMVWNKVQWDAQINDQPIPKGHDDDQKIEKGSGSSIPGLTSFVFTCGVSPSHATIYVNWREDWDNGAVYWHTTPIGWYGTEYGADQQTAAFQRALTNIHDWGVGPRADVIYRQAQKQAKRKAPKDYEMPLPERKRLELINDEHASGSN
ncbi:uncharacterized protein KY384_002898 [Bacidia gigantensis]|uniref:uncharacterized protein n=1 Tax=Bacidia gigantensis TaxID=2732470 RepID=UPI001D053E77|nr:uncharacterized protein KY384_002898 [Bacidia gigantensis]KAG8532413.1 hypothetical protein KY384_002898 [Bacidia gigantensis]